MKTIYLVFDQLPHKEDGGLVATYARFVTEFANDYQIKIVSIFNNGRNDIEEFRNLEIINFSDFIIDNRFFKAFSHLKAGNMKSFFRSIFSALYFFLFIPFARQKSKELLKNSIVIVSSPAAAIFVSSKVKFILEIHTRFEYFYGKNFLGNMQIKLASKPAFVLFRTKADADKAKNIVPSGYIYNGFDASFIKNFSSKKRKPFSALYVGGLQEHKNPIMLLHCAAMTRKKLPNFTLDIYGTGEYEKPLRQAIVDMDLKDTVHLKGFTDDKSVYSHYDLFWFTSKLDGFGLVLIESMANSTPVITTNWGDGVFEVIKNGVTGYIVENAEDFVEKTIDLLTNDNKRQFFGENALNDFNCRFAIKKNKEQWEKILRTVYDK